MSFAPAFRVSFAASTFQDLVSHLAFKPADVEILSKTLGIEDGKGPVGTLDTPDFEDLVFVRQIRNGDEHSCPIWTTQQAVRRRSISQRTRVAANTCVSSCHSRCLNCRTQPCSRSSRRGRAGVRSQCIATCSGLQPPRSDGRGSKWSCPMTTNRNFGEPTTPFSRAIHRAKARRVRWNSLPPRMPEWLPSATNLARTSPGSHRVPQKPCGRLGHPRTLAG